MKLCLALIFFGVFARLAIACTYKIDHAIDHVDHVDLNINYTPCGPDASPTIYLPTIDLTPPDPNAAPADDGGGD